MSEPNPYAKDGPVGGPGGAGGPSGPLGPAGQAPGPGWGPPPQGPAYGYPGAGPALGYGYPGAGPAPAHPPQFPGYGYPGAPEGPGAGLEPTALAGGSPLVAIGDITVLNTGSIVTPSGTLPLRGAVWNATDLSRTEQRIPSHAIVLAVVFFVFCFLGLLFLLMKEKSTTGFIQVTVNSGGKHHSTMVPATDPLTFQHVMAQIAYARSISV
ncbi:hypothetical protein [Streptomyces fuscigenes]|uniref:hypothetical protein n=1 Tax=Streptomyces fuscigenes TaxID=1528880 RepID=UPI001F2E011A|nr:hypothetical protein [Streptomyces fuscigenes]MCF3963471.1 hypothetical protein [Streptomyces fuscigenes]